MTPPATQEAFQISSLCLNKPLDLESETGLGNSQSSRRISAFAPTPPSGIPSPERFLHTLSIYEDTGYGYNNFSTTQDSTDAHMYD